MRNVAVLSGSLVVALTAAYLTWTRDEEEPSDEAVAIYDARAADITKVIGKRVSLHYEEKVGLPTSCFGDTRYFVTRVTEADEIPLGPGLSVPTRPASAASAP